LPFGFVEPGSNPTGRIRERHRIGADPAFLIEPARPDPAPTGRPAVRPRRARAGRGRRARLADADADGVAAGIVPDEGAARAGAEQERQRRHGRSSVAAKGALGCPGQAAGVCGDGQGLSRRRQDGEIRAREAENVVGRGGEAVLRDGVEARLAVRLGLGGEAAGQSVSRHAAAPTDRVAEDWAGRTDAARSRVRAFAVRA